MKRIASLLMLATRSTLWKAAGITLASCLAEAGLFLAALSGWQDTVRTAYYEYSNPMGLEGLLMQYPLSWCFRIGLVLVCAVLAFLGWEGSSRVSYTLRRLSVGHRALTLLWAGYGFFCLLFFWAAHLGTLLALCAAALPRLAPEFSGPQALFLACYRDPYLHSLLPLDDCLLWVRNLSMCAALGTAAASFSFQRRMGRRAFAILPLAALSARCPLFLVSNCQDGYIEAFFQAHGLGRYFTDYENPGRTGLPKADNIALVAERNGLRRPLYIGDTQGDYDAASKAGVPFLHAAYGFGRIDRPVPSVATFGDLPDAICRLTPP